MNIELQEITIRELYNGYQDKQDNGVVGYGGLLDIRPPFQREFIYNPKQRDAVIDTINKNFPLNVMYWSINEDDKTFELIDGQQRTVSICQYVNGDFSFDMRYFHNLTNDEKERILNYKLMIYLCKGSDSEKLQWFETINIAGEKLNKQELRNAVYSGPWVTDAKRYFSRNGCPAYNIAHNLITGTANRQDYFERAIEWISNNNIEPHMAKHQHDPNASALWLYFQSVITWVNSTFTKYRPQMKGVDWGVLYNKFKDNVYDTNTIEEETKALILDDDVTKKSGIYPYILTRDEKYLSIRNFSEAQKLLAYERQKGVCPTCTKTFQYEEMQGDHIDPWSKGGKTSDENCQMLCSSCNRRKSNI